VADRLVIWLEDTPIAVVTRKAGRMRFAYTSAALEAFAPGTPLLSLNLPLSGTDVSNAQTKAFLDGLLPEGESRRAAAERFDLQASDTFGLARELGRDCAGALVIQPEGEAPPQRPMVQSARALSEDETLSLIANLRSAPLGIGPGVRISLAGVQEKLLLTKMKDGGWGQPIGGSASTHIIKPPHPSYPNTVENEAFCMRLAHHLGLPAAEVEIVQIGEGNLLVVERYDRAVHQDGSVERLHQEDFCQAFGLPPDKKYEEDGGPSLKRMGKTLVQLAGVPSLELLLKAVTLNVLVGNGDAHGKNFALLHADSGRINSAPLYDIMSTSMYRGTDPKMAMYVDTVQRLDRVTFPRVVNEAASWGLSRSRAEAAIDEVLARLPEALERARNDVPEVPEVLLGKIHAQRRTIGG